MSKMDQLFSRGAKSMAGTEGTGHYRVFLDTALGGLGVRILSNGDARIRVEPCSAEGSAEIAKVLTREAGWKQPGDSGENRFSKVVVDASYSEVYDDTVKLAAHSVVAGGHLPSFRRGIPRFVHKFFHKNTLLRECRALGFKGVNRRWGKATLCAKVASAHKAA